MSVRAPVLVVDDDAVSRHVIDKALKEADIASVGLGGGAEGIAWMQERTPSLVLLDLVMPDPDGYEVLAAIRGKPNGGDVPVVVLTALDSDEEVARAFEAGADDFVRKPFRPTELVARIRGQLRLRSYIEALAQKERDTQVVLELTQALSSSLDFRQILFTVVQRIAEVARVDRCSIVLIDGTTGRVAATSDDQQLFDLTIDLDKYPEIEQVVTTGAPLVIENVGTHPLLEVVRSELPFDSVASLALLPIIYEERSMGVLVLRASQRISLRDHELSIARTVANATAIALRNARVVKNLKDKTERVSFARFKAERRLQLLKRYAAFFESGADGVMVLDLDGQILFTNAEARAITGHAETSLRGQRLDELVAEPDRAKMRELQAGFADGAYPKSVDARMHRQDGAEVVLSINFSSVLQDDNAVLMSLRDVTRERKVEGELRQTKEFLERVIGSSVNAIVSVDIRGVVKLFNRAAERALGYVSDQVIGHMRISDLFPEEEADAVMKLFQEKGKSASRIEDHRAQVLSNSGEAVPVTMSAALIFDAGRRVGAVVIFTDLRDKLRMEARLAAAQEELESRERQAIIAELAGAAAHELNQPLTSVMGYAELLKRKLPAETPSFTAAEVIMSEAERMAEIVRKIGKITRYETKSYVGAAKILDLDRASDEVPPNAQRGDD